MRTTALFRTAHSGPSNALRLAALALVLAAGSGGPLASQPACAAGSQEAVSPAATNWRDTATHAPQPAVGGVRLNRTAQWIGRPPAIHAATLDWNTGRVVLIGDKGWVVRGLKLHDLAMALWLIYGRHGDPQFSLDPADRANPRGPLLKAVYLPEELRGHSFGQQVFDADFQLKQYGFGIRITAAGRHEERRSSVPGYRSYAAMAMESPTFDKEEWSRFWITVDKILMRLSGDTIVFEVRMAVQARRQVPDRMSPTGLRDIATPADAVPARWARLATANYEALANEEPAFARVEELAKAVGLAKWMCLRNVPVRRNRLLELINADRTPAVESVTALSASWKRETRTPYSDNRGEGVMIKTVELHMFGGVDLSEKPDVQPNDGYARALQTKVSAVLRGHQTSNPYIAEIPDGDRSLEIAAVPLIDTVAERGGEGGAGDLEPHGDHGEHPHPHGHSRGGHDGGASEGSGEHGGHGPHGDEHEEHDHHHHQPDEQCVMQ